VRAKSILAGIEGVDWFHYAGHATRGENGWSGELALGHGQRVTAADLYLLRSAPRVAVLAACEAGGVEGARMTGGLTLATSMLLRGSEYVVAPISKVSDDVAGQFTAAFYEALGRKQQVEFAFQEGLRRTADGHELSAWSPFRLWRP
jgi:CHAT domain-containing protein